MVGISTAHMVMEYLQGKTLAQILQQRKGRLSEAEALAYVSQIGDALELLHSSQFLHRDIKPDNVVVTGAALHQDEIWDDDPNSNPTEDPMYWKILEKRQSSKEEIKNN